MEKIVQGVMGGEAPSTMNQCRQKVSQGKDIVDALIIFPSLNALISLNKFSWFASLYRET